MSALSITALQVSPGPSLPSHHAGVALPQPRIRLGDELLPDHRRQATASGRGVALTAPTEVPIASPALAAARTGAVRSPWQRLWIVGSTTGAAHHRRLLTMTDPSVVSTRGDSGGRATAPITREDGLADGLKRLGLPAAGPELDQSKRSPHKVMERDPNGTFGAGD